jgi:hypothetical protein
MELSVHEQHQAGDDEMNSIEKNGNEHNVFIWMRSPLLKLKHNLPDHPPAHISLSISFSFQVIEDVSSPP